MKKYRVRYETRVMRDQEGVEVVEASGKGQAMLAAQARVHPDQRADEPYFHFEPLTIRLLEAPSTYEVAYKTRIEEPVSGVVEVTAEGETKAASKARFAVHQELIPPKCFQAVEVVEVAEDA